MGHVVFFVTLVLLLLFTPNNIINNNGYDSYSAFHRHSIYTGGGRLHLWPQLPSTRQSVPNSPADHKVMLVKCLLQGHNSRLEWTANLLVIVAFYIKFSIHQIVFFFLALSAKNSRQIFLEVLIRLALACSLSALCVTRLLWLVTIVLSNDAEHAATHSPNRWTTASSLHPPVLIAPFN